MKKAILILGTIAIIIACNSNDKKTENSVTPKEQMDPEAEKGLQLIAESDCLQCHKVSEPSIGPAYEVIAEKYKGNTQVIDTLAERIINGSEGIWGSVPMISHPNLSKEDARSMVNYVLSLKK